ncbi:hypothetical protein GJAV_G00183600 [Gymnothorax javanicus]|nr:hypothetical protein GJAV_G00183600 [Gymnothorax javanicus]
MLTVVILTTGITLALADVVNMAGVLPVRLTDGDRCSGRVEVLWDAQWGALCGVDWDLREASVVCQELGCGWPTIGTLHTPLLGWAGGGADGGIDDGTMWLAHVECSGEEESLAHCTLHYLQREAAASRCTRGIPAAAQCSAELRTPEIYYNVSVAAPPSRVVRGRGFNVTCAVSLLYRGSSMELRLVRSDGLEKRSVPAHSPSVTFSFASASSAHEGYYYCLHHVQLGGRNFSSRESQPLPIVVIEPKPLLSAMEVSWLVSAVVFVVALLAIVAVACGLRKKKGTLAQLERNTRTCEENLYVASGVN